MATGPHRTESELAARDAELRLALARGALEEAASIAAQVERLLAADGAALAQHREAMDRLERAIAAILSGDNRFGIGELEELAVSQTADASLRWAACSWTATAAIGAGELARARDAAASAARIAEAIGDARARCASRRAVAEAALLAGEAERAIAELEAAEQLCAALDDQRGAAAVSLARARALAKLGRYGDSSIAARRASELDPGWEEPPLFLAVQALGEGQLDLAGERLAALSPRPPEASLLLGLVELIQRRAIQPWVVKDYLRLRDELPSRDVCDELQALIIYAPAFHHLRLELAWKLLKIGAGDEADRHFALLAAAPGLDQHLRPSLQLGIASVAALRGRGRPPGARAQAALALATKAVPAELADGEPEAALIEAELPDERPLAPLQRLETDEHAARTASEFGLPAAPSAARGPNSAQFHDAELARAMESVGGRRSVFSGNLHTLSIGDLLEFLRGGRRTGMLVVSSPHGLGAVYVRGGLLTNASSPGCTNIGDLLLAAGAITREQLAAVAEEQRGEARGRLMGSLFVARGYAPADEVRRALEQQTRIAIRELLGWSEGEFAFLPDGAESEERLPSIEVALDPQALLLDVAGPDDE